MPKVGSATGATRLRADHSVAAVGVLLNFSLIDGLPKTWPAGTGIELGIGFEKLLPAANADVDYLILALPVLAGKSWFGACLARYAVMLRRELFTPFLIGLHNLFSHDDWMRTHPESHTGFNGS